MKKFLVIAMLLPMFVYASVGKITVLNGDVVVKRGDAKIKGKTGLTLEKSDFITTSKNGKVQIVFSDSTIFTIGKDSTLDIADYLYDESQPKKNTAKFNVLKGAFSSITGRIGKLNKSKFQLKTKSASIGIRGTIVVADQEVVMCTEGAITVATLDGTTVRVEAGYQTDVSSGIPTEPTAIEEGDLEQMDLNVEANEDTAAQTDAVEEETEQTVAPETTDDTEAVNDEVNIEIATTQNEAANQEATGNVRDITLSGRVIDSNGNQQIIEIEATNVGENIDLSSKGMSFESDSANIGNTDTISWGHWDEDPSKKFVVGTQTDVQVLDELRNSDSATKATYTGQATGTVNGTDNIVVDDTNKVIINFELGNSADSMGGSIGFQTESSQEWSATFEGTTSGTSFSTSSIDRGAEDTIDGLDGSVKTGDTITNIQTGSIDGSFYGIDAEAVGGTFELNTDQDTATGVFKATK